MIRFRNAQYRRPAADVVHVGSDTGGQRGRHNLRAVLRQRGFRRLLTVRLLAQVADGLFQAGLAGSMLFNPERRAGALAIAAGFAVMLLPYSLIGPGVGVVLDRYSRKSIIFITNLLRAVLVVPTALLIWTGAEGLLFAAVTLVIIGLGRLFLAASAAATPHVVDDERLVTANAVGATLGSIGYSVGLAGVALLVRIGLPASFHGYAVAAVLAPLGYTLAALVTRRSFSDTALGPQADECPRSTVLAALTDVGRGMVNGIRHLAGRRVAAYALVAQSVHRALYGVLALATLMLYRDTFDGGENIGGSIGGLGGAFAAGGIGMLAAAFITPAIARRIGAWRWVALLFALTGIAVGGFGAPFEPALLPLAVCWVSAASQGTKIVVDTALQHECDDDFRGRVFSVNDTLFNLCFVAGTYAGALILPEDGRSAAVLLLATGGYLVLGGWYALFGGPAAGSTVRSRRRAAISPVAHTSISPASRASAARRLVDARLAMEAAGTVDLGRAEELSRRGRSAGARRSA